MFINQNYNWTTKVFYKSFYKIRFSKRKISSYKNTQTINTINCRNKINLRIKNLYKYFSPRNNLKSMGKRTNQWTGKQFHSGGFCALYSCGGISCDTILLNPSHILTILLKLFVLKCNNSIVVVFWEMHTFETQLQSLNADL